MKSAWVLGLVLLSACQQSTAPASSAPSAAATDVQSPASAPKPEPAPAPDAAASLDAWLGKWVGPEGTFLQLSREGANYQVTIQSLDGPATYAGVARGERIFFERNGREESIRAGSGAATGMKWLLDKKDCLVIQAGEGFCRD